MFFRGHGCCRVLKTFVLFTLVLLAGWVHQIQCTHYLTKPSYPGRIKINCLRKVWSLLPEPCLGWRGWQLLLGGREASLGLWLSGVCILSHHECFPFADDTIGAARHAGKVSHTNTIQTKSSLFIGENPFLKNSLL